jgi:hypothetical protein
MPDELEALGGDVLGDGGNEVARAEDLEVAVDFSLMPDWFPA